LPVTARDFKAVRRPTQVGSDREDLTVVGAAKRLPGISAAHAVPSAGKAFVVEPWKSLLYSLTIQQCADPAVSIRRPLVHQLTYRL